MVQFRLAAPCTSHFAPVHGTPILLRLHDRSFFLSLEENKNNKLTSQFIERDRIPQILKHSLMFTSIDTSLDSLDPQCYTLNTRCSEVLIKKIHELQDGFIRHFGTAVFCPRGEDLHATLLDLINPFIKYKVSREELFRIHSEDWKQNTKALLSQHAPISVQFSKLDYRKNTICLQGFDQGQCEALRKDLQHSLFLPKENKQPPRDIHITIITFREALDEDQVLQLLNTYHIEIQEFISFFRLVYSPRARLLDHTELTRFHLGNIH